MLFETPDSPKRPIPRQTHSVSKKIEAISLFDQLGNKAKVAKELKVERSLVTKWVNQRDVLMELGYRKNMSNKKRLILTMKTKKAMRVMKTITMKYV